MPNPNRHICPHCHQPLAWVREGVRLTEIKAMIFDAVKRSGEAGVSSAALMETVYARRPQPSLRAIKAHMYQINELLAEAGYSIKSVGRCWYLRQHDD